MYETCGVHERVLVCTCHLDAVILVGDTQTAGRTHQRVLAGIHGVFHG
jgi:hypothetical protein